MKNKYIGGDCLKRGAQSMMEAPEQCKNHFSFKNMFLNILIDQDIVDF